MTTLNNIKPDAWSRMTSKKLWRGNASWKWTTCGRGSNGQNSRSGWGVPDWFEWGQTPLFRRMPKLKGFSNANFKKKFNIVNLSDLAILAEKGITDINKEVLLENRIIRKKTLDVKLLWKWELKASVTIKVDSVSASAKEAVEKTWWKIELS
mgnify:CR=1 FL=1